MRMKACKNETKNISLCCNNEISAKSCSSMENISTAFSRREIHLK